MTITAAGKRIVALWLTICMLVSSFCVVSANKDYPDAKLVFSGFTLQYGQNGKIQGFVDVSVENINAVGTYFELKYDSDIIVPSNHVTNDKLENTSRLEDQEMFEQNKDVFPIGYDEEGQIKNFLGFDGSAINMGDEFFTEVDNDRSLITMTLFPSPDIPESEYIITETSEGFDGGVDRKVVKADERRVSLGRISFQVVDPQKLCSADVDLSEVLYMSEDLIADGPYIMYIDSGSSLNFNEVADYEWKVENTLLEVIPAVESRVVTAYSLYRDGTTADILYYLNRNMNAVIQKYSNGNQFIDYMVWNDSDPSNGFTIKVGNDPVTDENYNPRGGVTYTASQNYGDKVITVRLTVTEVIITGFDYERRVLTFPENNRPLTWEDLRMPDEITPIMRGTDDLYVPPIDRPDSADDWSPSELGPLATADPRLTQTYEHDYDQALFSPEPQWLTVPSGFDWTVDAIRNVLAGNDPDPVNPDPDNPDYPDETKISASVGRTDGVLTINVDKWAGEAVADYTDFIIWLPDGTSLSSIDNNDIVTVTITDGKAVITVNTSSGTTKTEEELKTIQSLINLGSDGSFKLSSVLPDNGSGVRPVSAPIPFTFDERENYYLSEGTDEGGNNYVLKDYSEGRKTMFPVTVGQDLSEIATYIKFPDYSTIPIAYHGKTGEQPAEYEAAKVTAWSIEGESGAVKLPSTAGETVTLIGRLENYSYTNFGKVQNPDNVYLKIKVTVAEVPTPSIAPSTGPTEPPDATPDPDATPTPVPGEAVKITTVTGSGAEVELNGKKFEYDKQQVGYTTDLVQEQVYTIENIGTDNIAGLSLRISDITNDSNSNPSKYVLSDPLSVTFLNTGDKTTFAVRTTHGLPVGKYTARVSVGSFKNAELGGFDISFEVTAEAVYKVSFEPKNIGEDINVGYGYLRDSTGTVIRSNTYTQTEQVDIYLELFDDSYEFSEWENDASVPFDDETSVSTFFLMPKQDVVVTPVFTPGMAAKIRLSALEDYNVSDNSQNTLRTNTAPYPATTFAENVFNYRTIVESDEEENYVKFTLKSDAPAGTVVTVTANGTAIPHTNDSSRNYTTDKFKLKDGRNPVVITTSYTEDGTTYTQTYTLIILRKGGVDVKMTPGNSPFGIIEAAFPGDENKTLRQALEDYFKAHHTYDLSDPSHIPKGAVTTYTTYYSEDAWSGTNYDHDPSALFIYNDSAFVDPGFTDLKDSDGSTVDPATVVRAIEPTVMTNVTTDAIANLDSANLAPSPPPKITPGGGEKCVIDLTSYKIRPGVYKIEYSFTDSDGSTRKFSRPLIVLARKGDANLTRAKEAEDYETIYERFTNGYYEKVLQSGEEWAKLYAYRVCDVTEDRNVNSIDANAVKNGVELSEYYEPLPKSIDEVLPTLDPLTASPEPVASAPPKKAELTLDYMGSGGAPLKEAGTPDITADDIGQTIWIGIGIKNHNNLTYFIERGLYSMDFAIDYDPDIFEPYYSSNEPLLRDKLIKGLNNFNFDSTAADDGQYDVAWWSNASLNEDAFTYDKALDTSGRYKTEFINVLSKDGTALRMEGIDEKTELADKTIYLLRIPFKLLKLPGDDYAGKSVDLRLTEHTFVLGSGATGTEASAGYEGEGKTRTTDVNNLSNHLDVSITDIFGTDGKYSVKGKITAWNRKLPIFVEFYRVTPVQTPVPGSTPSPAAAPAATAVPSYTFRWDEADTTPGSLKYGTITEDERGFCTWEFKLPVSNRFSYEMVVKKASNLTYEGVQIDKAHVSASANEVGLSGRIDMISGDVNSDGVIKLPDRAELMRFFNRQKPWDLDNLRFDCADLNGDGAVNQFDLEYILKRNYEKKYGPAVMSVSE